MDAASRLETVTNARGHVLRYGYLGWGGLEAVEHFVDAQAVTPARTVSYTYDLAGNLRSTSDTELVTGASANGPEEPAGRLYTFTYDALYRVDTATAHYLPGGDRVLDSDYDRFGNRSGLTHTGDGSALAHVWRYDELDRLFQAVLPGGADPSLELAYDANDARSDRSWNRTDCLWRRKPKSRKSADQRGTRRAVRCCLSKESPRLAPSRPEIR